jgi:hypothetical protein
MGEKDQPPQGSATGAGEYKKSSNEDERKPYRGRRNNRDLHRSNRQRATPSTHIPKENSSEGQTTSKVLPTMSQTTKVESSTLAQQKRSLDTSVKSIRLQAHSSGQPY